MPPQILVIGLSGPSSSGKTTLARLLRGIFNIGPSTRSGKRSIKLFILHEDDFYKTDNLIPVRSVSSSEHGTRDLQDWDCVEALNLPLLARVLKHVKTHGVLPDDMVSKEDQNAVGESGVSEHVVRDHHRRIEEWIGNLSNRTGPVTDTTSDDDGARICILDGFLLYPTPPPSVGDRTRSPTTDDGDSQAQLAQLHGFLSPIMDLRLFVPSTRAQTIERRVRRIGYVTLEGFWADPPGYVEDVVWPNYARDHAWLFGEDGSGRSGRADEGLVDQDVAAEQGVLVGPGRGERQMHEVLDWAVDRVREVVGDAMTRES